MRLSRFVSRKNVLLLLLLLLIAVTSAISLNNLTNARGKDTAAVRRLRRVVKKLEPLQKPLGEPESGDWLSSHDEQGETFSQYLHNEPITPNGERNVIYIQPLGDFSEKQRRIVSLSAEFIGLYFNRPVKVRKDLSLSEIPAEARRKHPDWGMDQILSTYVLNHVLQPRLPKDAAAYIAFTATDLWPGKGWNFVFGQASLRQRVGVWSIYRNGNADGNQNEFLQCLRRTLKTATHETGHMFSMQHCIAYQCNMCGSNNREESDRMPLHLCAECLAKLCWATQSDPVERYKNLAEFCREHALHSEEEFYTQALEVLSR